MVTIIGLAIGAYQLYVATDLDNHFVPSKLNPVRPEYNEDKGWDDYSFGLKNSGPSVAKNVYHHERSYSNNGKLCAITRTYKSPRITLKIKSIGPMVISTNDDYEPTLPRLNASQKGLEASVCLVRDGILPFEKFYTLFEIDDTNNIVVQDEGRTFTPLETCISSWNKHSGNFPECY
jgi:hypothetical protein